MLAAAAPATVLFVILGHALAGRTPPKRFARFVAAGLCLAGLAAVARTAIDWAGT